MKDKEGKELKFCFTCQNWRRPENGKMRGKKWQCNSCEAKIKERMTK